MWGFQHADTQIISYLCRSNPSITVNLSTPERDVLVVGRLHVAAQLVRRRPKLRLESKIGTLVVCLFRHLAITLFLRRGKRITGQLSNSSTVITTTAGRPFFSYCD